MAEEPAAGAVERLDPLADRRGAFLGDVAGRDGGVDRRDGGGLAGGGEPIAVNAELGGERVHEDVAVLAGLLGCGIGLTLRALSR